MGRKVGLAFIQSNLNCPDNYLLNDWCTSQISGLDTFAGMNNPETALKSGKTDNMFMSHTVLKVAKYLKAPDRNTL